MSDPTKSSGAGTEQSGAQSAEPKHISPEDHKRAIDDAMKFKAELKATREKLSLFEKAQKEAEEKKLTESGEYQKLIQLKEQKISELEQKMQETEGNLSGLKKSLFDAAKLNAVRDRLPGTVKNPAYLSFIDVDKIAINPETNEIDLDSVDRVATEFVKTHPDLIKSDPTRLPGGAAQAVTKLTHDQWLKLPLKEKKLRLKDVEGIKLKT